MKYPPRLAHLATKSVLVAKLGPSYSKAHDLDDEEGFERLQAALTPTFVEELLAVTWAGLLGTTKRLDEAALVEKVAGSLKDRPQRPGRVAALSPGWSAFLVVADLNAGTASDTARRLLESEEGRRRVQDGLAEVGRFLAAELTR